MGFGHTHLLTISTVICIVSSNMQNSELLDNINKMELSVFGKNPCQNCNGQITSQIFGTCFKENFRSGFGMPICKLAQIILHLVWLAQSQISYSMWLWLCSEFGI